LARALETVLRSAKLLSGFPEILLVFIGDGPEKSRLKESAEAAGLHNVRFFPPQPVSRMPQGPKKPSGKRLTCACH
jgi:hypothetical protein